jgi:lipopolysaccharide biosynthesis glycosyltransferase
MNNSIWIGFDPREAAAFAVAKHTIKKHLTQPIPIRGLVLDDLRKRGLYYRPTELRPTAADRPVLWDTISEAPMSTEHAISRFLVPHLAQTGWALFMDADMLVRVSLARLFEQLDQSKAVYCVKHAHVPSEMTKMDGQVQTRYSRKNWSSFVAFNCDHKANKNKLSVKLVNEIPGRDLHRFCWLYDEEIGELGPEWNFLVGHTTPSVVPNVVHFTSGTPDMTGYEQCAFAEEWREAMANWARGGS